ncbi:MAG: c-type cytochrome [Gemmatimonadetes bacterium]|nr:c-type cytochrome [Gemmatimonadota bacterium]
MRTTPLLAALLLGSAAPLAAQAARDSAFGPVPRDIVEGRRLFESQCARCHGVGGTGGVAPALDRPRLRRASTDEALVQVILTGLPGTAMIGFWNFTAEEATQVAAYVRALGRRPPEVLPGDPAAGARLYAEPGRCGACHILDGQGAGWAPDLSEVGLRLNAAQLRQSLTDPGAAQPISPLPSVHGPYPAFLAVEALTPAGRLVRGTRVTEDDFTLVLREADGTLRSLDKATLRRLRKIPGQSPMPSFAATFTATELDDLVAYLAGRRGAP